MMRLVLCIWQFSINTFFSLYDLFSSFHGLPHKTPKLPAAAKAQLITLKITAKSIRTFTIHIFCWHV